MNHASACVPWCQPQSWGGGWRQSGSCRGRTLEVCWCPGWGQIAQLSPESQSCLPSSEMFSMTPGLQWLEACLIPATHTHSQHFYYPALLSHSRTCISCSPSLFPVYPFHLARSGACWHGGRKQIGGVALVVQVVYDFSLFRFLCKSAKVIKNALLPSLYEHKGH